MTAKEAPSPLGPVADSDPPTPAGAAPAKTAGPSVGQLVDETPDAMTLHTQDAYRMFTGRAADPASNAPAIPGGRRFAAVLKAIWYLSANDNPYADWILIRVYQSLSAIRAQMGQVIQAREAEFERLRRRGLALSVLASRSPVTVELGFRSPYGYATAEAIVEFDYHVRMVKTLVLKDRMSDEAGRGRDPHDRTRPARAVPGADPLGAQPVARGDAPAQPARLPARSRRCGSAARPRRGRAVRRASAQGLHR